MSHKSNLIPGRKKGSKNRKTVALESIASRLNVNPFEVLCLFAKGDWKKLGYLNPDAVTPHDRLSAAAEACGYLYSKKKSIEISNPDGEGFKIEVVDFTSNK
jgi:hypothetical protein